MKKYIYTIVLLAILSTSYAEECRPKNTCQNYQNQIDRIETKMNNGYKVSEYNYLMDKLRYYKKLKADYCRCYIL